MDQIEKQNQVHSLETRAYVQVTAFRHEVILSTYGVYGELSGTIKVNRENLILAVDRVK